MTNFYDEPEVERQRQNIVKVAGAILDEQLGVVAGARQLCGLCARVSRLDHDPDFLVFMGIDCETDHLPLGDVRRHWAADALAAKDAELRAVEQRWREAAEAGCRRLVERFSAPG